MDPIVVAAGTAVVSAMATSAWETARDGVVALWRRAHPDKAEQAGAELEVVRAEVVQARRDGDADTEQALAGEWQSKLQRLVRTEPALADEVRRLLEEYLMPALAADEQTRVRSIIQTANATGRHNTIYQAGGNITSYLPPTS
ncbi:hypothetical protein GCM10009530_43350 [Microbispora corallina]|uniref:Uncharacterized protein n=1 Tax=Microbispora corallina TaxID=83302 RepID=A0ABQ4FX47_9ACTN|nr:hypothetical protein [Microbispora corallina]GIH39406.1 hypothetical protein Mco01_24060 [Microbispora corallina]